MSEIIKENPVIRISKHIVVEQIISKTIEVQSTPEFYKKDNVIPLQWVYRKPIDKQIAEENKYFVVEVDRNNGLTFSKYSDGSSRVPMKDIERKVVKTILKEGFNLETLKTFDAKLNIWIQEINDNIKKEEELCRAFLEEEIVMEAEDELELEELEELEL